MRTSILVVCSVVAVALAGAAPAYAAAGAEANPGNHQATHRQWHRFRHHRWHGDHWMRTLRQLDLSEAQRQNIRQLVRADFKQARPEMIALREKQLAFETVKPGTPAYEAASNDLGQAAANAALARMLSRTKLRGQIYKLLTPAQQTQLATIQSQRAQRRSWERANRPAAPAASEG